MLYTVRTNTKLQTIKDELEEKAKELGFGVLKEYAFKDLLKEKGYPIEQDITVFEICNPAIAQKILSKHPEVSVYLPCRISLYQSNAQVVLSTVEIEDIIKDFDFDDALKDEIYKVFTKLKTLLCSWNEEGA